MLSHSRLYTVFWSELILEILQYSDFRSGASCHFSPVNSINYGKTPQRKEGKKPSRYTETFSFQAPSHTTPPTPFSPLRVTSLCGLCLFLPYLARGLAHTSASWLHFRLVVKSIILIVFHLHVSSEERSVVGTLLLTLYFQYKF